MSKRKLIGMIIRVIVKPNTCGRKYWKKIHTIIILYHEGGLVVTFIYVNTKSKDSLIVTFIYVNIESIKNFYN